MKEPELQRAFAQIRQGDKECFAQVYRAMSGAVYTVAWRIVRRREVAEDITQDVFVKLFLSPPDASVKSLRAWIFRMTRNQAIDALRRCHDTSAEELPEGLLADVIGQSDLRLDVARAMSRLRVEEREVVALHIHGEMGFAEIAEAVGRSLPATYRLWRRALKQLREELRGHEV
ncbi:MAG: sigma-70 family RNA polymerase sigma factor [Clostridia bacterium]|nr:sigma-70 family RNA polymerase sigma factor [Clostridia bacterium]